MRFATGDLVWDIGVYGTLLCLVSLFLTAAQLGDIYFCFITLTALCAELWLVCCTYVPLLKDPQLIKKTDGELGIDGIEINKDDVEFTRAQQALAERNRQFIAQRREKMRLRGE